MKKLKLFEELQTKAKYTFCSPVYVEAEFVEYNESFEVFNSDKYMNEFNKAIAKDYEDLAQYVSGYDKEIYGKINSIELEGVSDFDSNIELVATVLTSKVLDNKEIEALKNYLLGQYSDGWGEGFEQRAIATDTEDYEDDIGYGDDAKVEIYAHPWVPGLNIKLEDVEIKK